MNFFESVKEGFKRARNPIKELKQIWDKLKLVWKYEKVFVFFYLILGLTSVYEFFKDSSIDISIWIWLILVFTLMRANYQRDQVNKLKRKYNEPF